MSTASTHFWKSRTSIKSISEFSSRVCIGIYATGYIQVKAHTIGTQPVGSISLSQSIEEVFCDCSEIVFRTSGHGSASSSAACLRAAALFDGHIDHLPDAVTNIEHYVTTANPVCSYFNMKPFDPSRQTHNFIKPRLTKH